MEQYGSSRLQGPQLNTVFHADYMQRARTHTQTHKHNPQQNNDLDPETKCIYIYAWWDRDDDFFLFLLCVCLCVSRPWHNEQRRGPLTSLKEAGRKDVNEEGRRSKVSLKQGKWHEEKWVTSQSVFLFCFFPPMVSLVMAKCICRTKCIYLLISFIIVILAG